MVVVEVPALSTGRLFLASQHRRLGVAVVELVLVQEGFDVLVEGSPVVFIATRLLQIWGQPREAEFVVGSRCENRDSSTMFERANMTSERFSGGPHDRAEELLAVLLRSSERGYIGEPVSQLEHALQCAAAATRARAPEEAVLAALFHDVGHLAGAGAPEMDGLGVADHEGIGARLLLEAGCSAGVAELVENHVAAKRYLCFRDVAYRGKLSEASRGTLAHQGGPMSDAEARRFEALPNFQWILALRSWDEQAKDPEADPPGLESYHERLRAHLAAAEAERSAC